MFIDYIFIGLIAIGAIRGWWRGYLKTIADIAGLVLGYILVWKYAPQAGIQIHNRYNIPTILGASIAGVIMFFGTSILASITGFFIKRKKIKGLSAEEKEEFDISDCNYGSWLGLIQGIVFSAIGAIILSIVPPDNKLAVYLELEDSAFIDIMRPLAPAAIDSMSSQMFGGERNGKLATAFLTNPKETQAAAQEVANTKSVKELVTSEKFQDVLKTGTPKELIECKELQNVLTDPKILKAFEQLGLSADDLQISEEDGKKILDGYRQILDKINKEGSTGFENLNPEALMQNPSNLFKIFEMMEPLAGSNNNGNN